MNPFTTLQHVQSAYLTYVHTFQKFQNPAIRDWVAERVRQDTLLLPRSSSTSESQHIRAGGRLEGVVSVFPRRGLESLKPLRGDVLSELSGVQRTQRFRGRGLLVAVKEGVLWTQ